MSKHYKSVFENEQELLSALIELHLGGADIVLDPMYNQGMFDKKLINKPKLRYDLNAKKKNYDCEEGDAESLNLADDSIESMILDPPFMFGTHGQTKNNVINKRYTMYDTWNELESNYKKILKESKRILTPKGKLIFKCQDYTDSKTTMTHALVYNWATELGFYAKDMAILVKMNKIFNGGLTQRHLRKAHSYFWVFEKVK